MKPIDRFRGCLLGLATGDALGTTLEFQPPGTFEPLADMVGGGPFFLAPGTWTDDTAMALCLAESLLESKGFDPLDQQTRYLAWYRLGHMSATGKCFDIGNTTRRALECFEQTGDPWSGPTAPDTAGNGSIMRLAPVPMYYAAQPRRAVGLAGDSSRTTHGAAEAVDGCRLLAALLVGALAGEEKQTLLSADYQPAPGIWDNPLAPRIQEVARGSYKHKNPPDIRGSGYVVESLEAALWAFWHSRDFAHGALLAVNLGDDADTTGAVYGQLAGAYYGVQGIPQKWLHKLARLKEINSLAEKLYRQGNKAAEQEGN